MNRIFALFALFIAAVTPLAAMEPWGLVKVPVASFRAMPAHSSELETQAPLGTPVRLLDEDGEWRLCLLPDSTEGWVNISGVAVMTDSLMSLWRRSPRGVVITYDEAPGMSADPSNPHPKVTSLVNGSIVEIVGETPSSSWLVKLPSGVACLLDKDSVKSFEDWKAEPFSPDELLAFAWSMIDTPYLWGGTSTKMNDCSGFSKILYFAIGHVILPRNSSAQAIVGERIDDVDQLRRGDLLFFLNPESGRVNHVGVYDSDKCFVHSSGRVYCSSLDPESPMYVPKVYSHAVRIFDPQSLQPLPGIVTVASHPWYND